MDTFFPSLKFWYFPLKVEGNKSFMYAKKSNIMTKERMNIENLKLNSFLGKVSEELLYSRTNLDNNKSSSFESSLQGSFRFNSHEMDQMNLLLEPIHVPGNSLVIADVSGMHSRGSGVEDISSSLRIGIHGNTRHLKVF